MVNIRESFIEHYKAARKVFLETLDGLDEAEANSTSGPQGDWPSIKDMIGHVSAWEHEVLVADEMLKRGEESQLHLLVKDIPGFNATQSALRHSWTLAQVRAELDLSYEGLLMAWNEYEGEEGPFGPATWQPTGRASLNWVIHHQLEHAQEIAQRRGLKIELPEH